MIARIGLLLTALCLLAGPASTPVAAAEAARLEAEYDTDRLKSLIANEGWAG